MPFEDFPKDLIPRVKRIELWINNIEQSLLLDTPPSTQELPPKRYNTRKRSNEAQRPLASPEKKRKPGKRKALRAINGNMGRDANARRSPNKSPEREPQNRLPLDMDRERQLQYGGSQATRSRQKATANPFENVPELPMRPADNSVGDPSSASSDTWPEREESASADTASRKTDVSRSSKARAKSPVKDTKDWHMAERPAERMLLDGKKAEEAGGFLALYEILRKANDGHGVIPLSLKGPIQAYTHKYDWPDTRCYTKNKATDHDSRIFETVLRIHKAAQDCDMKNRNEADWNAKVHGALLELVTDDPRYGGSVGCENVTSARIAPKGLARRLISGEEMASKMVDYAVIIKPDNDLEKRITRTLASFKADEHNINQTDYSPVRFAPFIFSVEAKVPFSGGQTSDIQHMAWYDAGGTKIQQLLEKNGKKNVKIPTIPVLSAHGHDFHLSGWYMKQDETEYVGKLRLGSTETVQGIFQILKCLHILVEWGNTTYRKWFCENVLSPL